MAKGIRINKVNLGRRHTKQKKAKAKNKKKNFAIKKEMLKKKAQLFTEELTKKPLSTRQTVIERKETQRKEKVKGKMDVEAPTKKTSSGSTKKTEEESDDNDEDDEAMSD